MTQKKNRECLVSESRAIGIERDIKREKKRQQAVNWMRKEETERENEEFPIWKKVKYHENSPAKYTLRKITESNFSFE